ncbi:SRA stem-loop-interacting RNA-binding protein, mitochondrial-like [Contarinia nasturtii]|uniref:SRA stem-loop-interacting RNA-binding protein, mitochondrial-like n=1 Tax=Contarinia nasturtii TaxID=265458 RepID=UPI0012D377B3|nr:SRA stem-loop-interacting RNA-binding protein, mitochondrial-like [Contarinia nasturtii]
MNTRLILLPRLNYIRMFSSSKIDPKERLSLYVSDLPWTVSTRELEHYFSKFGTVIAAKVAFNYETGFSKGIGFVRFSAVQAYSKALKAEAHVIDGKTIRIVTESKELRAVQKSVMPQEKPEEEIEEK